MHQLSRYSLDRTTNKLSEISRHNPQSEILATGTGGRKGHDCTGFSNVPTAGANTVDSAAKNEILID